jgi:hypothetical protein
MISIGIVALMAVFVVVVARWHPRPDLERPSAKRLLTGTAVLLTLEGLEPRLEAYGATITFVMVIAHAVIFLLMFGPDLRPTITRLGLADPERVIPIEPR